VSNPYGKYIGKELHYIQRLMEGFDFDDWTRTFELKFSEKLGGKYCIAVNSGTSALHAALVACGVGGSEVILPALCPAMVAMAVIHAQAYPVYCDIDPQTYLIDFKSVADKFSDKTGAILGVSLHGLPIDWAPIKTLRGAGNYYLIDDCAQALGAKGVGQADITCFSFEDKKHLTTGSEGGMIMTDDSDLATRARKFAGLGYKHMTASAGRTTMAAETYQDPDYERFDTIGLNYRMSKVQAAIGLGQMEQLDHIIARRRAVARLYGKINNKHSYYTYPIHADWADWKEFYKKFKANGGDGFYAEPLPPYKEPGLMDDDVSCPIAEKVQKQLMLMKTNYRDLGEAERQAEIFWKTVNGN
jgi:perosamine synthetase